MLFVVVLAIFLTFVSLEASSKHAPPRAPVDAEHDCIFSIKLNNLLWLDSFESVSLWAPDEYNFSGRRTHMTRHAVGRRISNQKATTFIIEYLLNQGVKIVSRTLFGEFVVGRAAIEQWESIFSTEFYSFPTSDMYQNYFHTTIRLTTSNTTREKN